MVMINGNCFGHSSKHNFKKDIMVSRVEIAHCNGRQELNSQKSVQD